MDILYYSNYCTHSQNIIRYLAKNDLRNKISFICIDKRTRDPKNNQLYIILENGTRVILPPNVHSVPALLLVKDNYKVILGDDIIKYYEPYTEEQKTVATKQNGEPMAFSLSGASAPVTSEQFTLYSLTPEELSSKGVGGRRQMYNYVSANQDVIMIQTPPDTYRPDKVSNSITVETIQSQRNEELPKSGPPMVSSL
jgi:glutaredoxin-related protein